MLSLRKSEERGHFDHGWLETRHSFSFADYVDPRYMGVSDLRVINDDRIAPGAGFPPHPHRDMEIVTYVMQGAVAHRDSMGNETVIRAGEVQRMSAGRGITHSEYNASSGQPLHLLQIWILPAARGTRPSYEQRAFPQPDKRGRWCTLAAPDRRGHALHIGQDTLIHATVLNAGERLDYPASADRVLYLHVADGTMEANGLTLGAGDGLSVRDEPLRLAGSGGGEALLFDLRRATA